MLRISPTVRVGKVAFPGQDTPQAAVFATVNIPANTYLWELIGVLSSDVVRFDAISVMQPHPCQNIGVGNRIMAGAARLLNHHCDPNCSVSKVVVL
jgi:hypothetical protein